MRKKVVIETHFKAGGGFRQSENVEFAQQICLKAIHALYNPIASHLFYPQFLNDNDQYERRLGMQLGVEWGKEAEEVWFCLREGEEMSEGMAYAYSRYTKLKKIIKLIRCHPDGTFIGTIGETEDG